MDERKEREGERVRREGYIRTKESVNRREGWKEKL